MAVIKHPVKSSLQESLVLVLFGLFVFLKFQKDLGHHGGETWRQEQETACLTEHLLSGSRE